MKQPIAMAWSGGKDSGLALHRLLTDERCDVRCLMTTITGEYDRISMHGVRRSLLEAQAVALGLPLVRVDIPPNCSNEQYAAAMSNALDGLKAQGVTTVAFGDIHLADVRRYREEQNARAGLDCIFPLWGEAPSDLIAEFLRLGFRTVTTCIDTARLTTDYLGREIDRAFLSELPPGTDPCGENGEYHSFVFAGPIFSQSIAFRTGERVQRGQFAFCDLLPE
jgi:uncharacterized protein (TIGR00290 family)